MISQPKKFYAGLGLMAGFIVVLILIFAPILKGQNSLDYLDSMYNSISKGSAYYIPGLREDSQQMSDVSVDVTLSLASARQAEQTALLLEKSGVTAAVSESKIAVKGSLGKILGACLDDADLLYLNKGKAIADKYGYDEKRVLFNWWNAFKSLDQELKDQEQFQAAKIVTQIKKKGVETAYNYYKIEPQKITDRIGLILLSLVFYVVYTMWYGFAIMYMFEGWGMKLEH
ncbi:MAG: hypothetical protein QNJ58_03515 [Desulfobacterales bacterium]|nr:hypothetical protein [Desulfobacterales bacterium]